LRQHKCRRDKQPYRQYWVIEGFRGRDVEILNSWKEIASYLGRGVRTVQRWERDMGLPVHRPKGKDRSAVLAFPTELDKWLHNTPVRSRTLQANGQRTANGNQSGAIRWRTDFSQVRKSVDRSKQLLDSVYQAAQRHQALTAAICDSLEKLTRRRSRSTAA
jgi:hypothetical protein